MNALGHDEESENGELGSRVHGLEVFHAANNRRLTFFRGKSLYLMDGEPKNFRNKVRSEVVCALVESSPSCLTYDAIQQLLVAQHAANSEESASRIAQKEVNRIRSELQADDKTIEIFETKRLEGYVLAAGWKASTIIHQKSLLPISINPSAPIELRLSEIERRLRNIESVNAVFEFFATRIGKA